METTHQNMDSYSEEEVGLPNNYSQNEYYRMTNISDCCYVEEVGLTTRNHM